jgi:nucleoside-diphosphate-sugar epimerase
MHISILGCGWLGLPLAQTLLQRGHTVKGSTTQEEKLATLDEHGITPYLIRFSPQINDDYQADFFNSDVLIVNIPPKRNEEVIKVYPRQIASLLRTIEKSVVKKVLFVSSTSVYPNVNRPVREADTSENVKASGRALLTAERMVQEQPGIEATVLRFCGLFGPDRNPGRFLAGKTLPGSGRVPVNMIHLDDCIAIITEILEQKLWGEVFNACADEHPTKEDFYGKAARQLGFDAPQFAATEADAYKVVDSSKLRRMLNYRFKYPDPKGAL